MKTDEIESNRNHKFILNESPTDDHISLYVTKENNRIEPGKYGYDYIYPSSPLLSKLHNGTKIWKKSLV